MSYKPTIFYLSGSPPSDELLRETRGRGLSSAFDYYDISTEGAGGLPHYVDTAPSICTYEDIYGGDCAFDYLRSLQSEKPALLKLDNPVDNALFMTVVRGHADIIKTLIMNGAALNSKNSKGQTPLHYAVAYKNMEVVQVLTEFGSDYFAKDVDGFMPIDYAKFYEANEILEFVHDHSLIEVDDQEVRVRKEVRRGNNLIVDYFNED